MNKKECRFLDQERNICYALNMLSNGKKPNCEACRFYQTLEDKLVKDAQVHKWYKERGMNYEKRVEQFGYEKT